MKRKNYMLHHRLPRYQPLVSIPISWYIALLSIISCMTCAAIESAQQSHLKLGEINVMVLTDVHSWVAGHLPHEPKNDADYGDVLSFYEHLRDKCHREEKDLFFVMNGDFIDGTGLTTHPPAHLIPILQQMPWDAVNIGNHELYQNSTIEFITRPNGFVDFWGGRYLTSNVLLNETDSPIGERYTFLKASFSNKTILTFGFLFNFQRNCLMTKVEKVEEVVQSSWFENVLSRNEGDFDAILVLAHMGYSDPLLKVILYRIREICGEDMPVQFITGHTHIRANTQLDYYSSSFEAGRFLDTIGLVSFPTLDSNSTKTNSTGTNFTTNVPSAGPSISLQPSTIPSVSRPPTFLPSLSNEPSTSPVPTVLYKPSSYPSISPSPTATSSSQPSITINTDFEHLFINTTVELMKNLVGKSILRTPNGTKLSNFIRNTQKELGLFEILGCSPSTFVSSSGLDKSDSLWKLFIEQVVPTQLFSKYGGNNNIFIQGNGALRYNLFKGNITLNDLISASPFNDTLYLVGDAIKGEDIINALGEPNYVDPDSKYGLPYFVFAGAGNLLKYSDGYFRVFTDGFNVNYITEQLSSNDRQVEPKELADITTSILWKDFMNVTWACPVEKPEIKEPEKEGKTIFEYISDYFETFTALKVTAFILTFIIIIFFGWMFVCRSHQKSMFSYSDSESGSDLSRLDDSSVDEFSSSEASQNSSVYMARGGGLTPPPRKMTRKTYQSFHAPDSEII
mmetsp:Transcript_13815/g.20980  ORF Transcript_13815/g.20980 Transcript_13815/m.20980 type:complete len:736 (+) Transcript_13815:3-2210(+)